MSIDYFKSRERMVDPGGFFGIDLVLAVHLSGSRIMDPLQALDTDLYDVKLYLSNHQVIDTADLEVGNDDICRIDHLMESFDDDGLTEVNTVLVDLI